MDETETKNVVIEKEQGLSPSEDASLQQGYNKTPVLKNMISDNSEKSNQEIGKSREVSAVDVMPKMGDVATEIRDFLHENKGKPIPECDLDMIGIRTKGFEKKYATKNTAGSLMRREPQTVNTTDQHTERGVGTAIPGQAKPKQCGGGLRVSNFE